MSGNESDTYPEFLSEAPSQSPVETNIPNRDNNGRLCQVSGDCKDQILEEIEKSESTHDFKCNVCNVCVGTERNVSTHVKGRKHRDARKMLGDKITFTYSANVELLRSKPPVHMSYYLSCDLRNCNLCCVSLGNVTEHNRVDHLSGKAHRLALKRLNEKEDLCIDKVKQKRSVEEIAEQGKKHQNARSNIPETSKPNVDENEKDDGTISNENAEKELNHKDAHTMIHE
eukprot:354453_1